jgi:hypothetical protein
MMMISLRRSQQEGSLNKKVVDIHMKREDPILDNRITLIKSRAEKKAEEKSISQESQMKIADQLAVTLRSHNKKYK